MSCHLNSLFSSQLISCNKLSQSASHLTKRVKKTKPASLCPDSRAALKEILEEKAEPIQGNQTEGEF